MNWQAVAHKVRFIAANSCSTRFRRGSGNGIGGERRVGSWKCGWEVEILTLHHVLLLLLLLLMQLPLLLGVV